MSTISANLSCETHSFYFRTSEKSLFGCYHRPRGKNQRDCGVVLCYPLGQEYIWSHRTFRQLAVGLSRVGFPVLRFDFTGCGDSEGDCDQWRIHQWKTDIESGIAELKTRGEVKKICLIGLRLGATLARMVGINREDIEGMVLWDPVINGMDYVEELKSRHHKHLVRYGSVPKNLTLENKDQEVFIQSTEIPYGKELESQIRKTHPLLEFQHLPSNPIWIRGGDGLTRKLVPQHIIKSVVSWTSEVFQ